MIKSYAARKYMMKNPDAKPAEVANKFNVYLTDVYQYKKQVQQARDPNSGISILPNGKLVKRVSATYAPTTSEPIQKIKTNTSVASLDKVVSKFVEKLNLDRKHAYALELLVKGEVKKADQVLTD